MTMSTTLPAPAVPIKPPTFRKLNGTFASALPALVCQTLRSASQR